MPQWQTGALSTREKLELAAKMNRSAGRRSGHVTILPAGEGSEHGGRFTMDKFHRRTHNTSCTSCLHLYLCKQQCPLLKPVFPVPSPHVGAAARHPWSQSPWTCGLARACLHSPGRASASANSQRELLGRFAACHQASRAGHQAGQPCLWHVQSRHPALAAIVGYGAAADAAGLSQARAQAPRRPRFAFLARRVRWQSNGAYARRPFVVAHDLYDMTPRACPPPQPDYQLAAQAGFWNRGERELELELELGTGTGSEQLDPASCKLQARRGGRDAALWHGFNPACNDWRLSHSAVVSVLKSLPGSS